LQWNLTSNPVILKEDFTAFGVCGIRVTRVTRIHNRFLRNRFEEHLESMVDVSDPTYKRSLEYLVSAPGSYRGFVALYMK
jgi:alpha-mannosidase